MKTSFFNLASIAIALAFVFTYSSTSAQCTKTLKTRNGTVMAGGPAKTTFTSTSNEITVKVAKTSGRAQTIINVYIDGRIKQPITFNNGNYTHPGKTKTYTGAKNKTVRIDIINQSVGNKFGYRLTVTGKTNDMGTGTGNLAGQGRKTVTFSRACQNKVQVTVRRTGGNAVANCYVTRNGSKIQGSDKVYDKNRSAPLTWNYSNANNITYAVVVKNVSVGNFFKFSARATQRN